MSPEEKTSLTLLGKDLDPRLGQIVTCISTSISSTNMRDIRRTGNTLLTTRVDNDTRVFLLSHIWCESLSDIGHSE